MPGRGTDLFEIPESFWRLPVVIAALRARDIGQLLLLVQQHTGVTQTQIGTAVDLTQPKISAIVRGIRGVEHLSMFERFADGLQMPDSVRIILGLAPRTTSRPPGRPAEAIPAGDTVAGLETTHVSGLLSFDQADGQEDDQVRRRSFVGLAGASLFTAMLAYPGPPPLNGEPLAPVLTAHTPGLAASPSVEALAAAVHQARREYQACRYTDLIKYLPPLLSQLHTAASTLDGEARLRVHALSAEAHHVAAGLLLKLDDQGLAFLAADRSMRAARASGDPLMVGASARIIAHTLMRGGHFAAATDTASRYAAQLVREIGTHTPESLSVYGSILLRGAIAAAEHDDRDTAYQLLAEADAAGERLGVDGNLRGTAFGPTNARQHRVNIAVTLGDAGTAVHVARSIDMTAIKVTERKASLLIDTARAFLQWGKHDKAYLALRAAEQTAHEEVTGRPAVHRLVRDLAATAPPTVRRDAEQFAAQIGATR
jgi:hypothetical protein